MTSVIPTWQKVFAGRPWFRALKIGASKSVSVVMMLACVGLLLQASSAKAQGTWSTITRAATHANAGVMLVLTDGRIMCKTSSGSTQGNVWDILTPDAHGSYANGTWTSTAAMIDDRLYYSSEVLSDGRVYVCGGEYGSGGAKGETYNPLTNVWTACPVPGLNISDANSELLPDGTVLQAAVASDLRHTYIYNPTTNTYVAGPTAHGIHNESVWVKLPDNSIIFVDRLSTNSERYIPASNSWVVDATVPVGLYDPYGEEAGAAFLLPNGKVFFIGSTATTAIYTPSGTTAPGTWATGPDFPGAPQGAPDAPAAMMVNGNIVCVVSPTPTSGDHFPDSSTYYEYNYLTNAFTTVNTPFGGTLVSGLPTFVQNMVCLPDGTIMFSYQGSSTYYIYTPSGTPLAAGKPTVSNVLRPGCDTFTAVGTLFNGITEGAAYGDDWQNSSNYPLVRLTSGTNVYYCRTFGWNRLGAVMTGSAADSVKFVLPASLPVGTYTLQVVANGNASAGTSFTTCGVSCSAPAITGTPSLCSGGNTTLADPTTGGTWISSNTTVAAINATTGVVTGGVAGTSTITYTVGGCTATVVVTVNSVAAITGTLAICNGAASSLSDATGGGAWTSSTSGVAAVSASGTITSVGPGTSVITYTSAAACSTTATVTINPSPAAISGASSVCQGSSTALSDGTGGGSWSTLSSNITVDGSGNVSGVSGGSATVTYSLGSCIATAPIVVNPLSPITGAGGVCAGSVITLSDAVAGGAWSSSADGIATVDASGDVSGVTVGTEVITYTTSAGCSTTAVVTVGPSSGSLSGITSVCAGGATTISSTVTGGTWSSSNATIANVDPSLGTVTGVNAGTATIGYTMGAGCSVSIIVTVNALPAAIGGPSTVCTGSSVSLTDATPGGAWTSSSPTTASVSTSGVVTGLTPGTATITYATPAGCMAATVITVNSSLPAITGTATVCAGSSTTLSDGTGGGAWSSSNNAIATVNATGGVGGVAAGSATIVYSTGTGCQATQQVTVNALPATISGAASVCTSSTTTLTDAGGGAWASSNNAIATVSSSGIVGGVSAGTVTITYTLGTGCSVTKTINVNTAPGAISGASTVCQAATTTLGDAVAGGTWSSSNTAIASVVAATGVVRGVAGGSANITYSVNGCTTSSSISVTPTPSAGTVSGTATVCVGSSVTLTDATTGGTWSSSNTAKASVSAGSVRGVAAGTATISYTVSNTCGSASATKVVTVNAAPAAPAAISGTASVCSGSTVTWTDATAGGVWSSSNTAKASVTSAGVVRGVASGTATISYTVSNTCGSAVATKVISVNTTPTGGTISGSTSVGVGATITLTESVAGGTWTSSNTAKASVTSAGVVRGVATGSATITYHVTNACGTATATKRVTVTSARREDAGTTEVNNTVNAKTEVQVFPNPTSGTFTIVTPGSGTLYLITLDGKQAGKFDISETTSTFTVPSQLAAGVYIYQFVDGSGAVTSGRLVYRPN